MATKVKKIKHKTNKSLFKKIKVTGSGKIMRSHQLRSGHLRRNKKKSTLRKHAVPVELTPALTRQAKRMLGGRI